MICNVTIFLVVAALLANIEGADAQQGPDPRIADLVQAGKIRVGLFWTQYTKGPVTGELRGVRVEIARALAARIGVPAILLEHRTPPDVVQCLRTGACDVVFLPRDKRADNVGDFSPPYLQSEYTILVPSGSSIRSIADADKPGIRIAAVRSHRPKRSSNVSVESREKRQRTRPVRHLVLSVSSKQAPSDARGRSEVHGRSFAQNCLDCPLLITAVVLGKSNPMTSI